METTYKHSYYDVNNLNNYHVIACYPNGEERITDPHNEIDWVNKGNTPAKISGNRFIFVVDGIVSVDPNMATILAAEAAAEASKVERAQYILNNLPAWSTVSTAIDNAFTNAQRTIIKKIARVVYILARGSTTD